MVVTVTAALQKDRGHGTVARCEDGSLWELGRGGMDRHHAGDRQLPPATSA
jgi:hypothetical protein